MSELLEEKKIVTEFTVDEEIWVQSQRFTAIGGNYHKAELIALNLMRYAIVPVTLVSLVIIMKNDPHFTSGNLRNYYTVLVIYLAMLSYQIYQWFFGFKNAFIAHPNLANVHLSYQFTRDFYLFKTTADKSETMYTIPYVTLRSAYETQDYLFLISKKRVKFVILKKALDESDMNDLRIWIKSAIDKRYYTVK